MRNPDQMKAMMVHLLTASGAVFAMLAMLAAVDGKWSLMFLWLVVAFVEPNALQNGKFGLLLHSGTYNDTLIKRIEGITNVNLRTSSDAISLG